MRLFPHLFRSILILSLILSSSFLLTPKAIAVDTPSVSDQASIAVESARELERRKKIRKKIDEAGLPEIISRLVEAEEATLPDTPFTVSQFELEGNTVFSDETLLPLTEPYTQQKSSLKKLRELTDVLTDFYRRRGYVTSRAVLSPQKVKNGLVRIQIYEGKIESIEISGLRYSKETMIRSRFGVQVGDVLRYQDLVRGLAILNANPDRSAEIELLQGAEPAATQIDLTIVERVPFHVAYEFNNLGTPAAGELKQGIAVSMTNLLGFDDQLSGRFDISERADSVSVSANYLLPLNSKGDLFLFDFYNVDVELGDPFKSFDAKGRALIFGPTFISPFFISKYLAGEFAFGFDYKRIRTTSEGSIIAKDDLRVFRFGPSFIENDAWGKTIWINQFQLGFAGFMGATKNDDVSASRETADGTFVQYNTTIGRAQKLWEGSELVSQMSFQFTPNRLLSSQQFRMGGLYTVRGYPEGDYLGDYGMLGSIELRIPPYFIPETWQWPLTETSIYDSTKAIAFLDFGQGFLNGPKLEEESSQHLMGVGGGLRVSFNDHLQARVEVGVPVGDQSTDGKNARLHFILRAGF